MADRESSEQIRCTGERRSVAILVDARKQFSTLPGVGDWIGGKCHIEIDKVGHVRAYIVIDAVAKVTETTIATFIQRKRDESFVDEINKVRTYEHDVVIQMWLYVFIFIDGLVYHLHGAIFFRFFFLFVVLFLFLLLR